LKPVTDTDSDYKDLVRCAYDRCAAAYAAQRAAAGPELRWLTDRLADGARVLDIDCGAGVPVAQALARRYEVVGVDLSAAMLECARRNVPAATFVQADVMAADFPSNHFDAAVAFYSIFHLPRQEHATLFRRVARWLKPGGYLLVTLTSEAEEGYTEDDFFGVTMYWSNYGLGDYLTMLAEAGFRIVETGVTGHGYGAEADAEPEQHPIVLARKGLPPSPPSPGRRGEGWEAAGAGSTPPSPTKRREGRDWGVGEDLWTALLCLSPTVIIGGVFLLLPILFSLYLSLHRWSILDPSQPFVGVANYQRLVTSAEFWQALRNTALYTAGTVVVGGALSLALAILLDQPIRGLTFYRTAYFMPVVTSTVAVAIVWTWIYNPQYGLLNDLLRRVGLPTTNWLADPRWALVGITIMGIWKTAGYNMVIFLAGLQTIPDIYYEAARIDGAGLWHRLRHITLPMLRPTTAFVIITSTIFSFQVFGPVYVMTGGGPMRSTTVIVYYLYQRAFEFREMGYASAVAWVLFLVLFSLSLLQFRYARSAVGA
jgi:multiple sugar transport system permease protein